jgi:hypothetical protein
VTLARGVLDQEDVAGTNLANFTIAGLVSARPSEPDEELTPRRGMQVSAPTGCEAQESDSLGLASSRKGQPVVLAARTVWL